MTWIDLVMKSTKELESPRQYFYWSAIATISAVMKKNVYIDRYPDPLYPNLYILLVGKSGIRKSGPVNMAAKLVDAIGNTRIVDGRSSIQGILHDLSEGKSTPSGDVIDGSAAFIRASELSSAFVENEDTTKIMTDLYDTHYHDREYTITLRSGQTTIPGVCFSSLMATNETYFRDSIPKEAITGGYIARTCLIYASEKHGSNPMMKKPIDAVPFNDIVKGLKRISRLKGGFTFSEEAEKVYIEWYEKVGNANWSWDKTETSGRIHDTLWKLLMCLSASESSSMIIEVRHVRKAIDLCMDDCINGLKASIAGMGEAVLARAIKIIGYMLLENKFLIRDDILRNYYGDFDALDLDRIVHHYKESYPNDFKSERKNNRVYYSLSDKVREAYKKLKERKRAKKEPDAESD